MIVVEPTRSMKTNLIKMLLERLSCILDISTEIAIDV